MSTYGLRGTEERSVFQLYLKPCEFTAVDVPEVHGAVLFLLLFLGACRIFILFLGHFAVCCSLL